jgi:ParB family chromosome partitioning protein
VLDDTTAVNIPALLFRAGNRLLEARTYAEVLEARQLAQAALHYAKITKAANETHADCLRIITSAEMRMADEVDRAQEAGEIEQHGGDRKIKIQSSDLDLPTLSDLGIDVRRLHEWREIRDAGPEAIEKAIQVALEKGRFPTKSGIQNHIRGTFGTGENEWYTPELYIDAARDVLGGIDLDPASNIIAQKTVRASKFFTKEDDGLKQEWRGKVWLNPPYAQPLIAHFVEKMVAERSSGNVNAAIMLTNNYTDTAWFHAAAGVADVVCFTKGRIRFIDTSGNRASPIQGQAFFYFGAEPKRFADKFSEFGFIMGPYNV